MYLTTYNVIKELETIVLTRDLSKYGLKKGDIGTVVHRHPEGGFEVEFVTLGGETVAVVSLKESEIRPTSKKEIPHVRAVA